MPLWPPGGGFKHASIWEIKALFYVPDEAFTEFRLEEKSLGHVTGFVVYSKEFF